MNKFKKSLPPLSALLPFEAAARLGSITQAGEELSITQAAISRQIKSLEDDLGRELFVRRNRSIHLTKEGKELHQVISDALELIASHATRLRAKRNSNEVILFAQLCEGLYWLMPHLSKFYQQYPNIEVRVSVSTTPITDNTEYFDLAFQTACRESGSCELVFTVPDDVFPVCSPMYLKGENPLLSLKNLSNYHLLHHKAYPQDWIDWDDWLDRIGQTTRVGYEGTTYDSYPMMMQAAIEGHGIALGWQITAKALLESGALVRPFKESLPLIDGLAVYLHPNCISRPEVEVFLAWLKEELTTA